MWTKSYSITTREATGKQMWKLFADVNNWHTWDAGIDYAKMDGPFEKGNHFILKPKGGPKVKIELAETTKDKGFTDLTKFPLAKMYGEHRFEETSEGLKITTTMTVHGFLSPLWVKLVARDIANSLPVEMEQQIKTASRL